MQLNKALSVFGTCLMICSCNTSKTSNEIIKDQIVSALSAEGRINLQELQWTREPQAYSIKGDTLEISTAPHTDLWQRSHQQRLFGLGNNRNYCRCKNDVVPLLPSC